MIRSKNIIYAIIYFCCFCTSSYSQDNNIIKGLSENNFKMGIPFLTSPQTDLPEQNTILTVLPHDGSHSRHSAPQSIYRFARCYFLITADEMEDSGFPSGENITSMGFNYQYGTDLSVTGYFRVYFENTSDIVNNKSINWNEAISSMTMVNSDSLHIQTASGKFDIPLNLSGAFNYSGEGIYVAFEFSNPDGPLAASSNVCWANRILPAPILRSSQSDDSLRVIAMGFSNFRPELRFGCDKIDIVSVKNIYAPGMTGISPCNDSAEVEFTVEHMRNVQDTIFVSTRIKNASSGIIRKEFNDVIISSLKESINLIYKIPPADEISIDSIIVNCIASGEETTVNNTSVYLLHNSVNSWSHFIPSLPPDGAIGLNSGTGECVARFFTSCPMDLCSVELSFFAENGWGETPFKVVIYSADGQSSLPGTLLHKSGLMISPPGETGVLRKPVYILNEPLTISPGYYFVGYEQSASRNLRISYQVESPVREDQFYFNFAPGQGNWIVFDEVSPFRIDVAPRTYLSFKLKAYLQGFYKGNHQVPDTVKVILRNYSSPYERIDSAISVLDSGGYGIFNFINVNPDSCYIFEVNHRNHIRTFSQINCKKLNGAPSFYDFTDDISKAYAGNMIFVPDNDSGGVFAFYAGDSDNNGFVDLSDAGDVYNNVIGFGKGYLTTDMTGDDITDLDDLIITYNNSLNFISVISP